MVQKMPFFIFQAPTHHSFTFNLQVLYELKHKIHLPKIVCWIFHFRVRSVFMDSLTLKYHNSFQNLNNRKARQYTFLLSDL